ncbi:coiled-coil domain containing 169 isoform X2 [Colossoma macropomum]|uniref:coiled-coil domain containing 169 isoform X2 n=1 Tax=Colossoma macropomum TaxID=42526 RepID=UPI00186486C2|nr:coiled-coil domain containing 169 isoform X2 [Colossoma macropomum]
MGDGDKGSYDLARLQAELDHEKEVKEMLEDSVSDLRSTLADLEQRLHGVEGEGNEWRTRYETQLELNGQLERQIGVVQERLEGLRGNPTDRLASIRSYDQMTVAYQKAYDERRVYLSEIAKVSSAFDLTRKQHLAQPQKAAQSPEKRVQGTVRRDWEGRRGPARTDVTQSRLPRLKR